MTVLEPDQPRPYSTWLYHHQIPIAGVYFAVIVAKQTLNLDYNPVAIAASILLAGLWVATWFASHRHGRVLCIQCMATFPLNGPEQATNNMRWLRLIHARGVLAGLWWGGMLIGFGPPILPGLTAALTGACWVTYLVWIKLHDRLCPWCPWCNPNKGKGEWSPMGQPTPVQSGGA